MIMSIVSWRWASRVINVPLSVFCREVMVPSSVILDAGGSWFIDSAVGLRVTS